MDLREYEQVKFELAQMLRPLTDLSREAPQAVQDHIRDLFVRLAEDRFNLVVVGRFGRGKSSLMNATLGVDRLPTGILPLTSVITTVMFGSAEKAVIHFEGRRLSTAIDLNELPDYLTQQRNPGNVKGVSTAEIRLPAEILRRGFHFIDTPGLGSAIAENTRTTEAFLPEADALLLVTSYDSPLSGDELALLRFASSYARRVFVIVNKQDTVTADQRDEGLRYVRAQVEATCGPRPPKVFSVSATEGLQARQRHDEDLFVQSGLARFEAELVRFLLEEKRSAFLRSFCERVKDIGRNLPPGEAADRIAQQIQKLATRIEHDRAADMRQNLRADDSGSIGTLRELQPCEICDHVRQTAFDFLCHFQYELIVNPEAQRRHAERGGLCAAHTRQYAALATPRGTSVGNSALLDRLALILRTAAAGASNGDSSPAVLGRLLPNARECVLCRLCTRAKADAIAEIRARFEHDGHSALQSLSGICMAHLPDLVQALDKLPEVENLLLREAAILERLSEDMRRYATKHDAIRRALASEEENEAADHAISMLAGLTNVQVVDDGTE